MIKKQPSESTLKKYTKEELVEWCLALQQQISNLDERLEKQYTNYMRIVEDVERGKL